MDEVDRRGPGLTCQNQVIYAAYVIADTIIYLIGMADFHTPVRLILIISSHCSSVTSYSPFARLAEVHRNFSCGAHLVGGVVMEETHSGFPDRGPFLAYKQSGTSVDDDISVPDPNFRVCAQVVDPHRVARRSTERSDQDVVVVVDDTNERGLANDAGAAATMSQDDTRELPVRRCLTWMISPSSVS